MSIYRSIRNFGKKALVTGGLVALLSGCGSPPSPSKNASSIHKILNSSNGKAKTAVLSTEVVVSSYNSNLIEGTKLWLEFGRNRILLLETEDLITGIESGDLNNDGTDDFIVSYRMFGPSRWKVVGTRSETYQSIGKGFFYTKS